jgi:hypothetical protein
MKDLPRTDMQGGGTSHVDLEGSSIPDSNLMEDTLSEHARLDGNLLKFSSRRTINMITFTALLFDPQANVNAGYRNLSLKIFNGSKTHANIVLWQIIGTVFQ